MTNIAPQTTQAALDELNERHCVIQIQGKVKIASLEPVETVEIGDAKRQIRMPVFSTKTDLKLLYENRFINTKATNENGEVVSKRRPLFDYWLSRKDRPTAVGFDMNDQAGRLIDGKFNLWQGLAVSPKKGTWDKLYYHIHEVIGGGWDTDEANYILKWTAWALQNPTKPAEVILVLQGQKGTGKGEFLRLLWYIFGPHALQIADRKHLVGSFNRHLQQVCFLYADEAFWPGDKAGEGVLKRLATEPTLTIEPKGIDAYEAPNRLSIAMSSNERWVVPASENERRYAVFEVSAIRQQDFEYFAALRKEIYVDGGAEAFLHEMLNWDLKGWHPRENIPKTQALVDQQDESADALVHWLAEILDEGCLPPRVYDAAAGTAVSIVDDADPTRAKAQPLFEHAKRSTKNLAPGRFWAFLSGFNIDPTDAGRRAGRWRQFPPLDELRSAFTKRYPWKAAWNPAQGWRRPDRDVHANDFLDDHE
jgi:hypothetical protein